MQTRLLVLTPVRNEAKHIECVARAMAAQTRPPEMWVIVDDGSTDATPEILARLEQEIEFLHVQSASQLTPRVGVKDQLATAAEARAFNIALNSVSSPTFTHIAKLDGDIELPPRYFELLLEEFERDPGLGLAGGVYADRVDGEWHAEPGPTDHHVAGALKCYTLSCFEAVGGVQERLGWDTIDETYARMRGFRTHAFPELVARHHRPWGSADGTLRGRARHGECAYIVHYPFLWVALRALNVARSRPRGVSGIAFVYGYLRSAVNTVGRVDDAEFRVFVRRELRTRMLTALRPKAPRRQTPPRALPVRP
jgi:glycosyltransferase involved in cell wall biosynthesis